MPSADDCFAALLEDGELAGISADLVPSARGCPQGKRGPKNANVGKLQVVVSELHRLFAAAWQGLAKPAMNQATMVGCFALANVTKSQVRWGQHKGTVVLNFLDPGLACPAPSTATSRTPEFAMRVACCRRRLPAKGKGIMYMSRQHTNEGHALVGRRVGLGTSDWSWPRHKKASVQSGMPCPGVGRSAGPEGPAALVRALG